MLSVRFRSLPLALGLLLVAGCATAPRGPDVTAADVPRLEAELEARPGDADVRTHLGVAYFRAGELEAARDVLAEAVDSGNAPGSAHLFLGLAHEELEEWTEAREAYSAYLPVAEDSAMEERVRARLALVGRRALQAEARTALTREAELSQAEPTPRSVAVFPFRLFSEDRDLEPLEVALADMMTTDLQLSGGLVVLERSQVQSLLDEMTLAEAGITEEATGARAGRLLRAEHVVQGALTTPAANQLRMDADVLATERRTAVGEVERQDLLEQLFDMEKEVVLEVIDILGVELTPAEREAIHENRAENLLAFLAYGRGLMSMDRGDYSEARQHFQQASQLDPSFQAAQQRAGEAGQLESASEASTTETAEAATTDEGTATAQGDMLGDMTSGVNGTGADNTLGGPGESGGEDTQASERDPTQEATGGEGETSSTTTTIITIGNPGSSGGGE